MILKRVDVLHCWMDGCNIIGGIAGYLTGIPRIVLSTRSVNPTFYPAIYDPQMDDWYKTFALSRRVAFIANSRYGARDYAQWLDLETTKFSVILNGIDFTAIPQPKDEEVREFRNEVGVDDDYLLVGGVSGGVLYFENTGRRILGD